MVDRTEANRKMLRETSGNTKFAFKKFSVVFNAIFLQIFRIRQRKLYGGSSNKLQNLKILGMKHSISCEGKENKW